MFAFEALEHVADPVAFIEGEFKRYGRRSMVLSTLTFSGPAPAPAWWYCAVETEQHISSYQQRTLQQPAARLGCQYTRIHDGLHLLLERPPPLWRRVLRSRRVQGWLEAWYGARHRRPSLTWADHEQAKRRLAGDARNNR